MSEPRIHIHAPAGIYIGQRRKQFARRWETVTPECHDSVTALSGLAPRMKGYAHGRVIFCTEYYDPNVIWEIKG